MNSESSYKQIAKSTGIFGSSQLVNVLLGIVRSKLTAVFLGAAGVGVLGLLQSVIDFSRSFSGLGLDSGAVKELAVREYENKRRKGRALYVVNIWYLGSAILGALFCVIFAKPLSYWAFDNYDYAWYIVFLSAVVFFVSLNAGVTAILQGLRKITYMALASTISSVISLLVMIPIYYYWGVKGILPTLILSAGITYSVSLFFYKRLDIKLVTISFRDVLKRGGRMIELGIFIVIAGILSTASLLLVRAYINRDGGLEDVGLFQVAWVITTLFWGIVLRSVNADYFPKLCSLVRHNKDTSKRFMNEQTHFILLIISPVIIGLIVFSQYVIYILYTSDFIEATKTLQWHFIGAFFKIVSTPIASVMLAKNRGGVHLICEIVFWGVYLISCYLLYPIFKIEATGLAYMIAYLVYIPTVVIAAYQLSRIRWNMLVAAPIVINAICMIVYFLSGYYLEDYQMLVGILLLMTSGLYSVYHLREIIRGWNIMAKIKNKIRRK